MLPDWVKRLISTAFIVKFGALGADLGLLYWIYRAARGSESMSKIVELYARVKMVEQAPVTLQKDPCRSPLATK